MKPSKEFLRETNMKREELTGKRRGNKLLRNMTFLFILSGITLFSSCITYGVTVRRHHNEGHSERH